MEFLLKEVFVEPEQDTQSTFQWVTAAILGNSKSSSIAKETLSVEKLEPAMEKMFGDPVEVALEGSPPGCIA